MLFSANNEQSFTPIKVLLGGPGSGKGTHGKALASALGYEHLSSGEHFRNHIQRDSSLGRRAREFVEKGQFVPDELAIELVRAMLADSPNVKGFVLDGFPRSLAQAEALEEIAPASGCNVRQALYLAVSDDEIVRRLSGRLTCRACDRSFHEILKPPVVPGVCDACGGEIYSREDDEPATIRKRIAVFHQSIGPLLKFYREAELLLEVPAEGTANEVSARVIASLESDLAPRKI